MPIYRNVLILWTPYDNCIFRELDQWTLKAGISYAHFLMFISHDPFLTFKGLIAIYIKYRAQRNNIQCGP